MDRGHDAVDEVILGVEGLHQQRAQRGQRGHADLHPPGAPAARHDGRSVSGAALRSGLCLPYAAASLMFEAGNLPGGERAGPRAEVRPLALRRALCGSEAPPTRGGVTAAHLAWQSSGSRSWSQRRIMPPHTPASPSGLCWHPHAAPSTLSQGERWRPAASRYRQRRP